MGYSHTNRQNNERIIQLHDAFGIQMIVRGTERKSPYDPTIRIRFWDGKREHLYTPPLDDLLEIAAACAAVLGPQIERMGELANRIKTVQERLGRSESA